MMPPTLDERNFDLTRVLANLKQSIDIHRIIGLNADGIESKSIGKFFFAHVQGLAIESISINTCKMFEVQKAYELNSIYGILKLIEDNQIPCKDIQPLKDFVLKYGQKVEDDNNVLMFLNSVLNEFVKKYQNDLERFKTFRDKRVAHAENIIVEQNTPLPSHAVMKELLVFGIDFYSAIQIAYMSGGPVQHEHNTKVAVGLSRLLTEIGIKEVKREFSD